MTGNEIIEMNELAGMRDQRQISALLEQEAMMEEEEQSYG